MSTKPHFAPGTRGSCTESCCPLTNAPATILPNNITKYRRQVVSRATTFKERDDPTGGAGMKDQSAFDDREVQRHPESGDKST